MAECSLLVAKNTLTLNYSTKIAIQTLEMLGKYGVAGLAGVLLRKEFMDVVETLKRVSGLVRIAYLGTVTKTSHKC